MICNNGFPLMLGTEQSVLWDEMLPRVIGTDLNKNCTTELERDKSKKNVRILKTNEKDKKKILKPNKCFKNDMRG